MQKRRDSPEEQGASCGYLDPLELSLLPCTMLVKATTFACHVSSPTFNHFPTNFSTTAIFPAPLAKEETLFQSISSIAS